MSQCKAIVIPIYNEVNHVKDVVHRVLSYLKSNDALILVDDGSNDGTEKLLMQWNESGFFKSNNITYIQHESNQGYGKALMTGFKVALQKSCEFILTMDCDDQHQPDDIPKFFAFASHFDIISGSRYLDSIEQGLSAPKDRKEINSKITQQFIHIAEQMNLNNWKLSDSFCGMKRYSSTYLKSLLVFLQDSINEEEVIGYGFPLVVWMHFLRWLLSIDKPLSNAFQELSIPRIYVTDNRSFGEDLDFPEKRYQYYQKCIAFQPS